MESHQMSQESRSCDIRKQVQTIAVINFIIFGIVCLFEFLSIFIEFPILFISEGDAAGIAEFSGNWLDHLLKSGIALVMTLVFSQAINNIKIPGSTRKKAYAFIIGGAFIALGIAFLYVMNYAAGVLNLVFEEAFETFVWYENLRLEMLLIPVNLIIMKIWIDKQRFGSIVTDIQ